MTQEQAIMIAKDTAKKLVGLGKNPLRQLKKKMVTRQTLLVSHFKLRKEGYKCARYD